MRDVLSFPFVCYNYRGDLGSLGEKRENGWRPRRIAEGGGRGWCRMKHTYGSSKVFSHWGESVHTQIWKMEGGGKREREHH